MPLGFSIQINIIAMLILNWVDQAVANVVGKTFISCVKCVFADRQCGGGAYDTFIYLCVTTPSVGHARVDESVT